MPRGDRTGPWGLGPRTGRSLGFCSGFNLPGYMNSGFGRGWGQGFGWGRGRGFGRGMGWGRQWLNVSDVEYLNSSNEEAVLQKNIEILKQELQAMEKRLKEIEKNK